MLKIGDEVKVVDENQNGKVLEIRGVRVTILTEDGFEETYNEQELIKSEKFSVEPFFVVDPESIPVKEKVRQKPTEPKIVDLHIGQLVDSFRGLTNFEMLEIQLQKVKDEMDLAIEEKRNRLVFIHGHGSGKLKSEMTKVLRSYKSIEIYDASFQKYKLGATEVRLR